MHWVGDILITATHYPGLEPRWSPSTGVFPAPDEGCESGRLVPLDEASELLVGRTPRAAYQNALAHLPQGPISAAWSDGSVPSLAPTEVTLSGGEPTHACQSGDQVLVYTSLRIESADGKLVTEPRVIASVGGEGMDLQIQHGWQPRAEFEATSGMQDLDMGLAEFGAWSLSQSLSFGEVSSGRDQSLRGTLYMMRWESYHAQYRDRPELLWCAGPECDLYWCGLTPTTVERSCGAVER